MITKQQYSIFEKQFGQAVADKWIATFGDAAKFGMDWMYNAMQAENERLRGELTAVIEQFEKVEPLYSRDRDIIEKAKNALK